MSKAFTREDDEKELDVNPLAPKEAELGTRKNYITPSGAEKLRIELKQLLHIDRPELVKVIAWAASNGDRSENGDYIYGKRKLREIDRRIRFLTKRLEAAVIVDTKNQDKNRVLFGAFVDIEDEEGHKKTFRIVGEDEIDAGNGWVSWISPVAKSLLNAKVGDVVTLRTPKGDQELEILKIRYD